MERHFVSPSVIFDYWKNKVITSDGEVINDDNEYDVNNSVPVVYDWGEPECWCCGRYAGISIKEDDADSYNAIKKLWNSKKVTSFLQKAHIVPLAIGGPDVPQNMFLMCSECHMLSPDTVYPEEFFKFVYNRRKRPSSKAICAIQDAARELICEGIPILVDMEQLRKEIGTHGSIIVQSSYKAAIKGQSYKNWKSVSGIITDKEKELLMAQTGLFAGRDTND